MNEEIGDEFVAVQWDGTQEAVERLGEMTSQIGFASFNEDGIIIQGSRGELAVELWDWVIKEGDDFSACDSEVFDYVYRTSM